MANTIYIYKKQLSSTQAIPALQSLIGGSIVSCGSSAQEYLSVEIDSVSKDDLDDILSKRGYAYVGEGSAVFASASILGSTLSSTPPTAIASAGYCFYATDLNKPLWYDGANWRDAAGNIVI